MTDSSSPEGSEPSLAANHSEQIFDHAHRELKRVTDLQLPFRFDSNSLDERLQEFMGQLDLELIPAFAQLTYELRDSGTEKAIKPFAQSFLDQLRKDEIYDRPCEHCKKLFLAKKPEARFCGNRCRSASYRKINYKKP